MKTGIVLLVIFVSAIFADTPYQKALKVLKQMNMDEKISMVHGQGGPYVGNTAPISRLKIPPINLEDGPQGVADGITKVTCWPSALTVVASWDENMMYKWAEGMAIEQKKKGTNVMLGPMINIARVPMGGRNFESFGEDPHLASTLVVPSVKGIQSKGVIACAKHYVDNNQELNRTTTSANVDERTQWEIYYPAFKAAVDAGVGSIMCSYNRIHDTWACENNQTLNVDLKGRMGYKGWVMSDWGATHSTVLAANSGLDQQMPDDSYFGQALKDAITSGKVPSSRLDDMTLRILVQMFTFGLFDHPITGNLSVDARSPEHVQLARHLAAEGTVLVKNSGVLPLRLSKIRSIAVIGDDGDLKPIFAGGGSGHVESSYVVTPYKGILSRASTSGVSVTYAPTNPIDTAAKLAASVDVAIVSVGTTSSEGSDRPDLSLGNKQDELIAAVAAAQPNTIVVVHHPGAVLMPWANSVAAIVCAFMPGQEDGNAIADVLFGDVNPSGKLPVTFPVTQDEIPVNTIEQYPGISNDASYSEKLLVGYRWYDAKSVAPLFPFGHGLSYTTFGYSNLQISGSIDTDITINVNIQNTGSVSGAEVVQLYLGYPDSAGEPPQSLRRFQKIYLYPGQTQIVTFELTTKDVSIWDVNQHDWAKVSGTFGAFIGSSSRDIRVQGKFTV